MDKEIFNNLFERIEFFFNIHMFSFHSKIANLAYEEYIRLILKIIKLDGLDLLKQKILMIENYKLKQKLLILLTPVDLEFCKSTYQHYLNQRNPIFIENQPLAWNNFVDKQYLSATKELLKKINKKYKIGLDELLS
jgi:hypothetical protein